MKSVRNFVFKVLVVIVFTEVFARICLLFLPLQFLNIIPESKSNIPILAEADQDLGWRNKAGEYNFSNFFEGKEYPQKVTINPEGFRTCSKSQPDSETQKNTIMVVGCSFSFGSGVSDEEAFPAILAQKLPLYNVINAAVPGYSTYQALLLAQKESKKRAVPKYIVYGFPHFHAVRNVATQSWLYTLSAQSKTMSVQLPFVSMGNTGELLKHRPEEFSMPFLCKFTRSYCALNLWFRMNILDNRQASATVATQILLKDFNEWANSIGSRLIVVLLDQPASLYQEFLRQNNITFTSVNFNYDYLPFDRLHPNKDFHIDAANKVAGLFN